MKIGLDHAIGTPRLLNEDHVMIAYDGGNIAFKIDTLSHQVKAWLVLRKEDVHQDLRDLYSQGKFVGSFRACGKIDPMKGSVDFDGDGCCRALPDDVIDEIRRAVDVHYEEHVKACQTALSKLTVEERMILGF